MTKSNFMVQHVMDFGYGEYLSADETDYIGRQVEIYNHMYTVVSATKKVSCRQCDVHGRPYKNDALLYLVCNYDVEEQKERMTHYTLASNIARPNSTIIHWAYNVGYYRKNIDECHALYELGKKADRKRKRTRKIQEFMYKQQIEYRENFYRQHTPSWAKSIITASYQVDDSDVMTDYFHAVTKKRVLLGFSKHTRNDARELKKFAALFEPTKELAENCKIEKYYGYQIMGENMGIWSTGWTVSKSNLMDCRVDFEPYLYDILPNMKTK